MVLIIFIISGIAVIGLLLKFERISVGLVSCMLIFIISFFAILREFLNRFYPTGTSVFLSLGIIIVFVIVLLGLFRQVFTK